MRSLNIPTFTGVLTAMMFLCCTSCKKFVEIEPAPELIETSSVFKDYKTALAAVGGVYVQMRTLNLSINNGGMSVYCGLSADEIYNTSVNQNADQFYQNSIDPTSSIVSNNFWTFSYRIIYQTNSIIEGLNKSLSINDSLKRQLSGEMKLVRAMQYFNLVNLFGDVPLILTTDYAENATKARNNTDEIYQQITTDLLEAHNSLLGNYPSSNRARPNKWTAAAFLAKVYLYKSDWQNAESFASLVINAGTYSLSTVNTVFTSINSNETIWQLTRDNSNTAEGATFIPASPTVRPTYALTNHIMSAFQGNDLRRINANWIDSNKVSNITYYYPKKYKQRNITSGATPTEYLIVLRLAEVYLIRSEARAQQNKIIGAQDDLNKVRQRAGLPNTTSNTQATLLLAVEKERQLELFCEWGNRWFDLKRTGKANIVLSVIKGGNWQITDLLYPLPLSQLQLNVFLTQNPGY
jgi:starch-binding outer membrane protein, SusD/RagB family